MTVTEALAELEAAGSEQTRRTYRRHGVQGDLFGVSFATLGVLKKRIKTDHELAQALWASGNHDARVLATMIADPNQLTRQEAETWAADLGNYALTDALVALVARTPFAVELADAWQNADDEWIGTAGWTLVGRLAAVPGDGDDSYFERCLAVIRSDIHNRKNRVRYAMNGALISIGVRSDALREQALEAAAEIGTVVIDHGDTDCKTPDAADYIRRTLEHRQKKKAGVAQA